MKKPAFFAALVCALALGACSRDTLDANLEKRASSPSAAEFNRQTSEASRTPEETRDSAAAAGKRQRGNKAMTPPQ